MRRRILIALVAAMSLSAPALAQTSTSGQTAPSVPAATESRAGVTWDMITGNWKRFKGKIRRQWGKLTNDDLAVAQGRREELVGKIQARYGIDKEQADKQVEAWLQEQR